MSVIRPIRGLDTDAELNIRAAIDTGYPGEVETIFVFDDESDPALAVVRNAMVTHAVAQGHGTVRAVISGPPPCHRTGKLHATIAGLRRATGEIIAIGDSDTRPDRSTLRRAVEALLSSPNTGAAFAPAVARERPHTSGDAGVALLLNGLLGPAIAEVLTRFGSVPVALGALMVFRRASLAQIGGLESLSGELVDDMELGARMSNAGYRNVTSSHPVPVVCRDLGFLDFCRLLRRWVIFARSGLPTWSLKLPMWLRGACFWSAILLALVAWLTGHPQAALLPALAATGVMLSLLRLHCAAGGSPAGLRHLWICLVIFMLAPLAYLSALVRPRVFWRDRCYQLDLHSRLSVPKPVPISRAREARSLARNRAVPPPRT